MGENQASDSILQKCYQPLPLSHYKVVHCIVGYTGHVSIGEGSDDSLFRGGDREIVETRRVPDNVLDIVDHELHFYNIRITFIS